MPATTMGSFFSKKSNSRNDDVVALNSFQTSSHPHNQFSQNQQINDFHQPNNEYGHRRQFTNHNIIPTEQINISDDDDNDDEIMFVQQHQPKKMASNSLDGSKCMQNSLLSRASQYKPIPGLVKPTSMKRATTTRIPDLHPIAKPLFVPKTSLLLNGSTFSKTNSVLLNGTSSSKHFDDSSTRQMNLPRPSFSLRKNISAKPVRICKKVKNNLFYLRVDLWFLL